MKVDNFYAYREEVSQNGIFLTFNGAMVHGFMVKMGDTLKAKLAMAHVDNNLGNKIFSLLIELAQNVVHYSSERVPDEFSGTDMVGVGILTVGQAGGHYFVMSGNKMPTSKVSNLRSRLQQLQSMNQDELKAHYKEQRRKEPDIDSKGAGLGFIEMARKASEKFEFHFHEIDEENSFFTLKATV